MSGCDFQKKSFSIPIQINLKDKNVMDWDKVFKKSNASKEITFAKRQQTEEVTNA